MEKTDLIAALAALAQDNRLDVFRLLVQAGPDCRRVGSRSAWLAPNTLTFHFDRLRNAGLVTSGARVDRYLRRASTPCAGW
jgi:DNA-binding transcriptional ArsR family regulator